MESITTSVSHLVQHKIAEFEDHRGRVRSFNLPNLAGTESISMLHSSNAKKGTFRGFHYQDGEFQQKKYVWAARGRILDLLIDLKEYYSDAEVKVIPTMLDSRCPTLLEIPHGFAHGYLTLDDEAELIYVIVGREMPSSKRTIKWNDPKIKVSWPIEPKIFSNGDRA